MMTIDEFIAALVEDLELEGNITPGTKFASVEGWSSLSIMETIVLIDREFGKTIKGTQLMQCETIKELYDLITA
jgi:acyl carrier protein